MICPHQISGIPTPAIISGFSIPDVTLLLSQSWQFNVLKKQPANDIFFPATVRSIFLCSNLGKNNGAFLQIHLSPGDMLNGLLFTCCFHLWGIEGSGEKRRLGKGR